MTHKDNCLVDKINCGPCPDGRIGCAVCHPVDCTCTLEPKKEEKEIHAKECGKYQNYIPDAVCTCEPHHPQPVEGESLDGSKRTASTDKAEVIVNDFSYEKGVRDGYQKLLGEIREKAGLNCEHPSPIMHGGLIGCGECGAGDSKLRRDKDLSTLLDKLGK